MITNGNQLRLSAAERECLSLAADEQCNPQSIEDLKAWQQKISATPEGELPEDKLLRAISLSLGSSD